MQQWTVVIKAKFADSLWSQTQQFVCVNTTNLIWFGVYAEDNTKKLIWKGKAPECPAGVFVSGRTAGQM